MIPPYNRQPAATSSSQASQLTASDYSRLNLNEIARHFQRLSQMGNSAAEVQQKRNFILGVCQGAKTILEGGQSTEGVSQRLDHVTEVLRSLVAREDQFNGARDDILGLHSEAITSNVLFSFMGQLSRQILSQ